MDFNNTPLAPDSVFTASSDADLERAYYDARKRAQLQTAADEVAMSIELLKKKQTMLGEELRKRGS